MRALEHRIPPPAVLALIAAAMWLVARWDAPADSTAAPGWREAVAILLGAAGVVLAASGVTAFRRARTTINPVRIDEASALVTSGSFAITRNPMYLGMLLLLLGWTTHLASSLSLLGPIVFVLFITRFQILPEERTMAAKFGDAYATYRARVRRWV